MAYGEWVINGIIPQWIESVDWSNYPQVTLNCAASPDEFIASARDEIKQFMDVACASINQIPLLNGGNDLQITSDGEIISISEGDTEWQGAIYYPQFAEDSFSDSIIQWSLVLELLVTNLPSNITYVPDYRVYPNIDYNLWNGNEVGGAATKWPQTVAQSSAGAARNVAWTSPDNIMADDSVYASSYNNSGTPGWTYVLKASNFGFNIPTDMVIKRVVVKVRYANNSKIRSPAFKQASHRISLKGIGADSLNYPVNYVQNSSPSTRRDAWWDTAYPTKNLAKIKTFSSNPSLYNSPNFTIWYWATLDRWKTCWVDSIRVSLYFEPAAQAVEPDSIGTEIGSMTIVEEREVKLVEVTGSACNIPSGPDGAWLEINGNRQKWHYSHNHNTGDTGTTGEETLSFTVEPPSNVLEFSTSTHYPYQVAGNTAEDNSGSRLKKVRVIYV